MRAIIPQQPRHLCIRFLGAQYYRYHIRAQEQLPIVLVTGLLGIYSSWRRF